MNPNQSVANPRAKGDTQMKVIVLTNYGSSKSTCGNFATHGEVQSSRSSVSRAGQRLVVGEAGVDAGGAEGRTR